MGMESSFAKRNRKPTTVSPLCPVSAWRNGGKGLGRQAAGRLIRPARVAMGLVRYVRHFAGTGLGGAAGRLSRQIASRRAANGSGASLAGGAASRPLATLARL